MISSAGSPACEVRIRMVTSEKPNSFWITGTAEGIVTRFT